MKGFTGTVATEQGIWNQQNEAKASRYTTPKKPIKHWNQSKLLDSCLSRKFGSNL